MDKYNKRRMKEHLDYWYAGKEKQKVIDIGSYDVNGSFKDLFPDSWEYQGVDIIPGPNVDKVMGNPYTIPFPPYTFDLAVSSSCFQYVKNPFRLTKAIHETLKEGGSFILCAPREEKDGLIGLPKDLCPEGKESFDCWRFLPDGMAAMLEEANFSYVKTEYHRNNCWGVAVK